MNDSYDFVAIGGGSGGLAAAQRAALHGARAAVIESGRLGGTCVNVGCVPKKVMWYAAQVAHQLHDAAGYGFDLEVAGHDWHALRTNRDAYVARLNAIYARNLERRGVTLIRGHGRFRGPHTIDADGRQITARHIVIATGGRPRRPDIPGAELGMVSDDFFELDAAPKRVAIVGSGYIAVELAGMFAALGTQVKIFVRYDGVLRDFDPMLRQNLHAALAADGIDLITQSVAERLEPAAGGVAIVAGGDRHPWIPDQVLWAIGRQPNSDSVDLAAAGIETDERGAIVTDEYQNTGVDGIYAIGDVTGRAELTPVAIAAGRRLADRVIGGDSTSKLDYRTIPTVVFSHPPLGTVGMTEPQARERYGDSVRIYEAGFKPMFDQLTANDTRAVTRLIVAGHDERVVGLHVFGPGADEMLQGFAVAIRMGATKRDFDDTVAIHPTAAEEVVTLT